MALFHDPRSLADGLPIFLIQAFLVLVVTRLLGRLLRCAKQPAVVGEILGGILLGPSVLGRSRLWRDWIFPASSLRQFGLVANVGLILFMFFLGLELDPQLMRRQLRVAVPIAVSAVVVPFLVGSLVSLWIYEEYSPPAATNCMAFVLFFGASISFTAFPVLAAILQSDRLLADPMGILAFSCAAIDDVMAWCVLAFATSFSASASPTAGVYTTLLALGHVAVMLLVVRPGLRQLGRLFAADGQEEAARCRYGQDVREPSRSHVSIVFLVLLASSCFTELIGIHAFFGAFVAGIVVPKEGGLPYLLAPKIELVVVDFLLPLYFANSGLRLDLSSVVSSAREMGTMVAIIAVACVAKFLPTFLTARLVTKRPWRFCASLGVLMNTRGLVQLIVLNIGVDLHILSTKLFAMMIVMAIVTTVAAPPLFYVLYARGVVRRRADAVKADAEARQASSDLDQAEAGQREGEPSSDDLEYSASIAEALRIASREGAASHAGRQREASASKRPGEAGAAAPAGQ